MATATATATATADHETPDSPVSDGDEKLINGFANDDIESPIDQVKIHDAVARDLRVDLDATTNQPIQASVLASRLTKDASATTLDVSIPNSHSDLDSDHYDTDPATDLLASVYYNASTMATLNPQSIAAVSRLRAYKPPPFALWDKLPTRKRAAVLILLYADRWGDLRVVITMRAASLRSFSGHAALPGGKADSVNETPYQVARREAYEEIGLPMDDSRFPKPFRVEKLCYLPPALARNHLIVTPCVAFLHADQEGNTAGAHSSPLVEESLIPRLDAREVAAVFSAPFYNFLKTADLPPQPGHVLPPGQWYDGIWIQWKDVPWRAHTFYVPVNNQKVSKPKQDGAQDNLAGQLEAEEEDEGRFKVWGMTGRILVDAARIAYGEEPEMEHNATFGDTDIILRAYNEGDFDDVVDTSKKLENEPSKM